MSMTAVQGIIYRNVCNSHNCDHHASMAERIESQVLIQQRHDREREAIAALDRIVARYERKIR